MRRHPTDAVSLGFGLVFLALAAWWLVARYIEIDIDVPNLGWIIPVALIVLGLIGVVASLRRAGRHPETEPHPVAAPGGPGGTEPPDVAPAAGAQPEPSAPERDRQP